MQKSEAHTEQVTLEHPEPEVWEQEWFYVGFLLPVIVAWIVYRKRRNGNEPK